MYLFDSLRMISLKEGLKEFFKLFCEGINELEYFFWFYNSTTDDLFAGLPLYF